MPKRSRTPEGFERSADGASVKCGACIKAYPANRPWIQWRYVQGHIRSLAHQEALLDRQDAKMAVSNVEATEEEGSEDHVSGLQSLHIPFPVLVEGPDSESEDDLRLDFEDVEGIPTRGDLHDLKFQKEMDDFGIWDMDDSLFEANYQHDDIAANELADNSSIDSDWWPYDSQAAFLLDMLDHIPRMKLSDRMMGLIIWLLKQCKVEDVPSLKRLREMQKSLREMYGVRTRKFENADGLAYHVTNIGDVIARDWSNKAIRPQIQIYPEIPTPEFPFSEIWHGEKWRREVNPEYLCPLWEDKAKSKCYYVGEICRDRCGRYYIPTRWLQKRSWTGVTYHADALPVSLDKDLTATIGDTEVLIHTDDLDLNYIDLAEQSTIPRAWNTENRSPVYMPHPDRSLDQPVYVSFIELFTDDVSGNKSKSWNKHINQYFAHRNLPREVISREFHVHFASTSQHVSATEQFVAIKKMIEETWKNPIVTVDAATGGLIRVRLCLISLAADNPMASEIGCHIGGNGNHYCRRCDVGGTTEDKMTDTGYHSLFAPAIPRTKLHTIHNLRQQVESLCFDTELATSRLQTLSGIKGSFDTRGMRHLIKRMNEMQITHSRERLREVLHNIAHKSENELMLFNPVLTLDGFDPAADTPVEILHTILLGIVKYVWLDTYNNVLLKSEWKQQQFVERLKRINRDGLSIPPIKAQYIMKYGNSLVGRHFRTLVQTAAFALNGLLDTKQLDMWKAVGELSGLIWFPSISNKEVYLRNLQVAIHNVMDCFADADPRKIITKIKIHLLCHLPEDINRFGPLIGLSSERFESFNAVFRLSSVYSNRHNPSFDIAQQQASQEWLKYLVSGSFLSSYEEPFGWKKASLNILETVKAFPLSRVLGLSDRSSHSLAWQNKGTAISTTSSISCRLDETQAAQAENLATFRDLQEHKLYRCSYLFSRSKDKCNVGSWIFATYRGNTIVGRLVEILKLNERRAIVVLDVYELLPSRHEVFQMPLVKRMDRKLILSSEDILFNFNVQPDFQSGTPPTREIVNTHSFHNLHVLYGIIPAQLIKPVEKFENRCAKHRELAARMRREHAQRRQENAAMRQARTGSQIPHNGPR